MVTDQLTENDVVSLAANYLRSQGWTVHRELTVNQKGVDLFAERDGILLYAEAKGVAHSKTGKTIDAYGASHSALMQAGSIRTRDRKARVAIIMPDLDIYRYHMKSVEAVLEMANIEVWLVSGGGAVRRLEEATASVPWPQPSLPTIPT